MFDNFDCASVLINKETARTVPFGSRVTVKRKLLNSNCISSIVEISAMPVHIRESSKRSLRFHIIKVKTCAIGVK